MTPSIIVTRGTITTTWHDVSLTRGKFLIFLKNSKKINKNSKNPETDTWHPFNGVSVPLTKGTKLRQKQIEGPNWDFATKMRTKGIIKPKK